MADDYRAGEYAGHPHWWCNHCGRDFTNEAAAAFHAETRHGAAGTASGSTPGRPPMGRQPAVQAQVAPAAEPEPEPPKQNAPKADWVAYAESLGVDTVDDDGRSLTKKQLIERTSS